MAEHEKSHQLLLKDIIGDSSQSLAPNRTLNPPNHDDESGGGNEETSLDAAKSYDSEEAMIREEGSAIKHKVASEVTGVELVRLQNGKAFLIADRDKVIAKWTCLGGYGSGRLRALTK